jgi:hypothetical protein
MHAGALRALEFDRIITVVSGLAVTPTGEARLAELTPAVDAARVIALQRATTEGTRFLADHPGFPLRAPSDLDAILDALSVEGRALEALRLLKLGDYLESIEQSRQAIRRVGSAFPILSQQVDAVASFAARLRTSAGRSNRQGTSRTTRALRSRRFAIACDGRSSACGPRSTRSCAGVKRRSISRNKSSPIATAGHVLMVRANIDRRSPASSMVDQRAARASSSSRSRPSRSTTRSSRSKSRRWRSPAHPARADRRVPRGGQTSSNAPSKWRPRSTSSRRARDSR